MKGYFFCCAINPWRTYLSTVDIKSLQALFGGAPDPVHYDYLKPAETLADLIGLARITIIPNNVPPHRSQLEANSTQCKHMLELAIADKPLFTLDGRELKHNAPSYTTQTLKEWWQEQGPDMPLAFTIGQDSLLIFPTWHEYETIFDNAHLIVCRRPGYPLGTARPQYQQWLEDHLTHSPEDLHLQPAGKIYLAETPWFNISAAITRGRLQNDESCEDLLPEPVLTYANQQGLYR